MSGINIHLHTEGLEEVSKYLVKNAKRAELAVAKQVESDTRPFVPARTLSQANRTQIRAGVEDLTTRAKKASKDARSQGKPLIIYPGPYARYLYYGKVMVDSATGKGPMHYTDKKGNDVIKFRKGAKLVPTDRDLDIKKSVHKAAQSHWFEASKAQNIEKWKRVAAKAVTKFGNR